MKTLRVSLSGRRGFTLVEMIGVLAVIAVLTGLLIPRVFSAIGQSRINTTALGYNSLKSASLMYFGKYGTFADTNGSASGTHSESWDDGVLLAEGLIEKKFETQLATNTHVHLVPCRISATVGAVADGCYDLAGDGSNTVVGTSVVEAVLKGVSAEDAKELNDRIDGTERGAELGASDIKGRVKFDIAAGATGTVHLYIAHK